MAVAELPKDHVYCIITQQQRHLVPGIYELTIGCAHEYIKRGVAKIDPRSEKEYAVFSKKQK